MRNGSTKGLCPSHVHHCGWLASTESRHILIWARKISFVFFRCLFYFFNSKLFFWFSISSEANQPESKSCVQGYLFPLPVALGHIPHQSYDATAGKHSYQTPRTEQTHDSTGGLPGPEGAKLPPPHTPKIKTTNKQQQQKNKQTKNKIKTLPSISRKEIKYSIKK